VLLGIEGDKQYHPRRRRAGLIFHHPRPRRASECELVMKDSTALR
jgi:hypothetical protein